MYYQYVFSSLINTIAPLQKEGGGAQRDPHRAFTLCDTNCLYNRHKHLLLNLMELFKKTTVEIDACILTQWIDDIIVIWPFAMSYFCEHYHHKSSLQSNFPRLLIISTNVPRPNALLTSKICKFLLIRKVQKELNYCSGQDTLLELKLVTKNVTDVQTLSGRKCMRHGLNKECKLIIMFNLLSLVSIVSWHGLKEGYFKV